MKTIGELKAGAAFGTIAISAVLSAIWAILNGAWAMMTGLNKAYAVQKERSWWKILAIAFALTISFGIIGLLALAAMLYGGRAEEIIGRHVGLHAAPAAWRVLQWAVKHIRMRHAGVTPLRIGCARASVVLARVNVF